MFQKINLEPTVRNE